MSSDDSQTVSFLKGQLAKAEDELKKKQDANADATVVATYQADVVSLTNRIVSQLALEQEKKEAALKEEKEKKEAALMEEKEKMAAALKEAQENHRALLKEMTANAKGLSAAEKEIHYKYLLADSEGEVKKLQAVVDTLTNAVLGLGGTLTAPTPDARTQTFINHLVAGEIVEEWYDVPVHYFNTVDSSSASHAADNNYPTGLAQFLAQMAKNENISDLTKAAGNAAVKHVRLPFLRCTDKSFLFNEQFPLLFIRSQYISLCDEIFACPVDGVTPNIFVLDGNSGVGKSMFIYYFMYRLHEQSSSYRVANLGRQGKKEVSPATIPPSMTASGVVYSGKYNWGIFDSTPFVPDQHESILLVTSDHDALWPHLSSLKEGKGFTRYLCMSAWSYAETCAVGLSPRRVLGGGDASEPTLATDTGTTSAQSTSADRGVSDSASISSSTPSLSHSTTSSSSPQPAQQIFAVLHPMYVFSHFVAFCSTPRELARGMPISYITSGPDGRTNSTTASDPEFMFLKRCNDEKSPLTKYISFKSVLDRSFGDIKSSLWISGEQTSIKGMKSLQASNWLHLSETEGDASQLTSLDDMDLEYTATTTPHTHMVQAVYLGIAQDLARSMLTNTDNKQFRDVLAAIFPFLCSSIAHKLSSLCAYVYSADSYTLKDSDHHVIVGSLTFRLHPDIIYTQPERDYDADMPRHLTIITSKTPSNEDVNIFRYYFRSTAIKSMVSEQVYATRQRETRYLTSFIQSTCSSSGFGYCYEYFSMRRLMDTAPMDIEVSCLSSDAPITKRAKFIHLEIKHISYFFSDQHVKFDGSGSTLFVPLDNSYPSFDCIGVALLPTGPRRSLVKHLVFYQMTIRDKHPVNPTTTLETVKHWKGLDQEKLPAVLVFVTDNSEFTMLEQTYTEGGLAEQYVCQVDMDGQASNSRKKAKTTAAVGDSRRSVRLQNQGEE